MARICNNQTTDTVLKFLNEYICINGVPKTIRSDNGTAFTSENFKKFCEKLGIKHITGLPNLHTATGLVERTVQRLKNFIRANKEEGKNLIESLQLALRAIRTSIHTKLGKSPFELHFGREPRKEIHNILGNAKHAVDWLKSKFVSANPDTLYAYAAYDQSGEPVDSIILSKKKTASAVRRAKSPESPLSPVSRTPYICYEKNIKRKTTDSIFKKDPIKIIEETDHTVTTENGRKIHKKLVTRPLKFQPNYSNRGKGPRDPVTQRFTKCAFAPAAEKRTAPEEMESELPQKTSTPKATDETVDTSKETVDLTQSTSSSGDQTGTPRKNGQPEGIRKSNRQFIPVTKYGGVHYSTRYKNK